MAAEWADVPAYAEALERMLGPGSLERLIGELGQRAGEMGTNARRLFERWLDLSVPAA
jgi:hypothetical protein